MTQTNAPKWIDSDAHIFESADLWDRLPAHYRSRIQLTPMTDDPILSRLPMGCDTAIDGHPLPIIMGGNRASRFEKLLPAFRAKYKTTSGSDPRQYIADMDLEGLDRVVIYPTLFLWAVWMPQVEAPFAAAIARAYNDWIYDFCATDRRRLQPIAAIALHDVDLAIEEAKRCAERGFVGVFVRPNPLFGRSLGHPSYRKLWEVLQHHQLTVGVHEGQLSHLSTLGVGRTEAQWGMHCMSHPFEQMAAMLTLLENQIFDDFPKLNFLFLEAGTPLWVGYWLNRLDAELKHYRKSRDANALLPSELFARQGWVTAEVDDPFLAQTLAIVSPKKLLFSTDYPHQESPYPHSVSEFQKQPIPEEARLQIGCTNAFDAYPRLTR